MSRFPLAVAAIAALAAASAALASWAGFLVSGKGIALGKPEEAVEEGQEVHRYRAKAEVGKPFTLTTRGVVYPRGAVKGQPSPRTRGLGPSPGRRSRGRKPSGRRTGRRRP